MEAQIVPRKREVVRGKHHYSLAQIGNDILIEIAEKYEGTEGQPLTKIDEEDIEYFLRVYASNTRCDMASVQEIFHCRYTHFLELMKSEKWSEEYANAKKLRGDLHVMEGYRVACTPFQKIQNGEEVYMVEVAAAKLMSNYDLMMGKALNPEWESKVKANGSGGNINLVVNTPIKLGI